MIVKTDFYNHLIYYGLRLVCHFFFVLTLLGMTAILSHFDRSDRRERSGEILC